MTPPNQGTKKPRNALGWMSRMLGRRIGGTDRCDRYVMGILTKPRMQVQSRTVARFSWATWGSASTYSALLLESLPAHEGVMALHLADHFVGESRRAWQQVIGTATGDAVGLPIARRVAMPVKQAAERACHVKVHSRRTRSGHDDRYVGVY